MIKKSPKRGRGRPPKARVDVAGGYVLRLAKAVTFEMLHNGCDTHAIAKFLREAFPGLKSARHELVDSIVRQWERREDV